MANRRFDQFRYSLEKKVVDLFAHISIGATGAPTIIRAKGISTIARTAAGKYKITFEDHYNYLLFLEAIQIDVAAEDITFQIDAQDMDNKNVEIICKAAAAATDPTNGSSMLLKFTLSNTSI